MKKEIRIIFLAFSILLISFLVFNTGILNFIGKPSVDSRATSVALSVSITIKIHEECPAADSNGTTEIIGQAIREHVQKITGLNQGDMVNVTFFGNSYPSEWIQTAPSTSEVKSSVKYFEINFTNSSGVHTGNFNIYFNITQAELGSTSASNVRLFVFEDNTNKWTELTTTVVDSSSDIKQFSALSSHFSRFIVGETPSTSGGGTSEITGTSGRGGGEEISSEVVKEPIPEKPEPFKISGNLFDISVLIPEKYTELFNNEELFAEIKIFNIKRTGLVNINLEYFIEDKDKNIIFDEYESKTFDSTTTFFKQVKLPLNIKPGYYIFVVRLKDGKDSAIAGYPFIIKEREAEIRKEFELIDTLFIFEIIVFIIFITYIFNKYKNRKNSRLRKENIYKQIKEGLDGKKR